MRLRGLAFLLWLAATLMLAAWQAGSGPAAGSRTGGQKAQAPPAQSNRPAAKPSGGTARAASKTATSRKNARRPGASRTKTVRARVQQAPTPERYAEIQRALIQRGYLSGSATGNWGADSVEALKRFQQDHNLEPTGKINALTLIALGLGPNRASQTAGIPPTVLDGHDKEEKPE